MVFHVNKTLTHKRIVTKMLVSLFIISTLLFFVVQLSPVFAQDEEDYGASFTGAVSDEGIDVNDDGSFEYLRLSIEVNVTVAGQYSIDAGGLYNSEDVAQNVIISNNKTVNLDVGVHVVDIDLDGTTIFESDATFQTIGSIYLMNSTGDTISELYDVAMSDLYAYSEFQTPTVVIEITKVDRAITLDQAEKVATFFDSYTLTSLGYKASEVSVAVPEGASNIKVRDEMGYLDTTTEDNVMTITFRADVETDETETVYILYNMPWDEVVSQNGDNVFQYTFFEGFDSTIGKVDVSLELPNGGEFTSSNPTAASVSEDGRTVRFSLSNVLPSQNLSFSVNYSYNVLYSFIYPVMWVGIMVVAGVVLFFVLRKQKTATVATTVLVDPKDFKTFVDAYEEKATVRGELEDLEERLQKGKVPRRRYKVRRKMLEGRLSAISRNLSTVSDSIRAGGSKYVNMIRQIEVAEAKLDGARRDMERIKARYSRGEVSKGAYGKLIEEYQSQIEDAEATIDGVLLRLRD
jgi:hypothetical protein